ncbi:RAMP superfamily CRISPR-associated protein [Trichothermofontia sp.]
MSQKPYHLIPFPQDTSGKLLPLAKGRPPGLACYKADHYTGKISLRLHVHTATTVLSGITVLGSDISSRLPKDSLVKTALSQAGKLIIPGSSLKGAVRSIYEAITRSCICKVSKSYKLNGKTKVDINVPQGYKECSPRKDDISERQVTVCPACQVFGAINCQGLVSFSDAVCIQEATTKFVPSLYQPHLEKPEYYSNVKEKLVGGRKFYYHFSDSVHEGERGIKTQLAVSESRFEGNLRFTNLTEDQLGGLLIALGKDQNHQFALKVGTGKPIGMGSLTVDISEIEIWTRPRPGSRGSGIIPNLRDRYRAYTVANDTTLTGQPLQTFMDQAIQTAHRELIQAPQLQQLAEVLRFPTDRTAPQGMY